MPVLTPWDERLGSAQGRVDPALREPLAGSWALVLGADLAGLLRKVAVGDFIEVEQTGDLTGVDVVRLGARVRAATSMPGDTSWKLRLMLDGSERAAITLNRDSELLDLAIPIGALAGDHRIGFRLELYGTAGTYEVELPGVYLDQVVLDTPAERIALVNRDPAPGEADIPINRSIRLDVIDVLGTVAITGAATSVYVNGTLAYSAGVFQTGFTGSENAQDATVHGGFGLRLTVDPNGLLPSDAQVSIRVVTSNANGSLDETYAFSTEDVTAPTLLSASALGRRTVRLVFSEEMGDSVFDAENYAITIASTSLDDGLPAVDLEVVSVEQETSASVLLTTDIEQTMGALYAATVTGAEDTAGNEILPPANVALFAGYACPVPAGRRFEVNEFVPVLNIEEDETQDLRRFLAVIQEVVNQLLCDIDHWTEILDPDTAPEDFLDVMLLDLGNPFAFDLSVSDKRRLVRLLVPIFRQKGTATGIINAIRFFLGVEVTITYPAFEGTWILGVSELGIDTELGSSTLSAPRYSYRIHSPVQLTDEQRERMRGLALYMQVAHEHLIEIVEPPPPPTTPDHWELGLSALGTETILH